MLEAPDAATAIGDFAGRNGVDHTVTGARSTSAVLRYLGSVSSRVVAGSGRTATLVRSGLTQAP